MLRIPWDRVLEKVQDLGTMTIRAQREQDRAGKGQKGAGLRMTSGHLQLQVSGISVG